MHSMKERRERRVHFRVFISSSLQNTFQLQISPYFIVTNFPPKKGNRWFSCTFSCKHTGIMYQCCCQRFNTSWGVANAEEDWAQRNVLLTKKTTNKKKIHLEITRIPVWKKKRGMDKKPDLTGGRSATISSFTVTASGCLSLSSEMPGFRLLLFGNRETAYLNCQLGHHNRHAVFKVQFDRCVTPGILKKKKKQTCVGVFFLICCLCFVLNSVEEKQRKDERLQQKGGGW